TIGGFHNISDVKMLGDLREAIGGKVTYGQEAEMEVYHSNMDEMHVPNGKVKKLHASYYLMGAMLGRFKKAVIELP
ncbi:UDP-N-acetylglucosamine 1-carboxyvinyltransferase, partial [Bacillus thuringiensis]|nr:UDP-N-acetylglucosamine 1-carboxyvinyltransferase [Bacillus thuringiensis]